MYVETVKMCIRDSIEPVRTLNGVQWFNDSIASSPTRVIAGLLSLIHILDVYIRYLRKKLDDGFSKKLIHTVRGAGYVLRLSLIHI